MLVKSTLAARVKRSPDSPTQIFRHNFRIRTSRIIFLDASLEFYIYCVIIVINLNSVRLENNGAWQSGILDLFIFTFYIFYNDTIIFLLEPFHGIFFGKTVLKTNLTSLSSSVFFDFFTFRPRSRISSALAPRTVQCTAIFSLRRIPNERTVYRALENTGCCPTLDSKIVVRITLANTSKSRQSIILATKAYRVLK
ncbi:hypothetical protein ALC53_04659 [Atta colombica]|uniref:Uncharacterized protein n=1 Tax=Atta colombica TaxID=520822 RepID=A0A195BJQ1_9HYME|nr:hypothetical protein ALC53_04659 [Atta colombica]